MPEIEILQVWRSNLEEAFDQLRDLVEEYTYIAVDCVFPGIVARPIVHSEYNYQTVKINVDLLKCIQLAFTLADGRGEHPRPGLPTSIQFNFQFNQAKDIQQHEAADFLAQHGVDMAHSDAEGIDPAYFGELMFSSGLAMNESLKWIAFRGSFDFGFLLKSLTCSPLPNTATEFRELLRDHFPSVYDVECISRSIKLLPKEIFSFTTLCETLGVPASRLQTSDMSIAAAVDSYLCLAAFFKLVATHLGNKVDDALFSGVVAGLDETPSINSPHSKMTEGPLPPGMLRLRPSQISSFMSKSNTESHG